MESALPLLLLAAASACSFLPPAQKCSTLQWCWNQQKLSLTAGGLGWTHQCWLKRALQSRSLGDMKCFENSASQGAALMLKYF